MPGRHNAITGLENLDKVIDIDQRPIGRTPRSNPATYTKLFDAIRDVFAMTPEARAFYKWKNIAEVLEMSVREVMQNFSAHKDIMRVRFVEDRCCR